MTKITQSLSKKNHATSKKKVENHALPTYLPTYVTVVTAVTLAKVVTVVSSDKFKQPIHKINHANSLKKYSLTKIVFLKKNHALPTYLPTYLPM